MVRLLSIHRRQKNVWCIERVLSANSRSSDLSIRAAQRRPVLSERAVRDGGMCGLPHANILVGLNAQSPPRVGQAVIHREDGICRLIWPIHRLEPKVLEGQVLEPIWQGLCLRKDQLQLLPRNLKDRRTGLWADADPIDASGCRYRSVGFHGDFEPPGVERLNERRIKLHQWLATCANHQLRIPLPAPPHRRDMVGHRFRCREFPTAATIGSDEVRVAEGAGRTSSIAFESAPQIAAGEAQKHGRAARLPALALHCQEDLLGGISPAQ